MKRSRLILLMFSLFMAVSLGWFRFSSVTAARPQLQLQQPTSGPAVSIDAPAQELLQQIHDAYQAAGSLVLVSRITLSRGSVEPRMIQTNSWFQRSASKQFHHEQQDGILFGSDGNELYAYRSDENTYLKIPASCTEGDISALPDPIPRVLEFCNPSLKLALAPDAAEELLSGASKIELLADTTLDGTAYKTLRLTPEFGQGITWLLVDPRTYLLRQAKHDFPAGPDEPGSQALSITVDYTSVQVNVPIKASRFAWTSPAGAQNIIPPQVTLGRPAPDFRLQDLKGTQVQLSGLRGNVVVLDFWATWCGPCRVSLPMLEQVSKDVDSPKLRIFTVNREESAEELHNFVQETGLSLPVLLDPQSEAAEKYRVRGIPQTVVIGKDGVVKFIAVGIKPDNERRLRQAIRLALEAP